MQAQEREGGGSSVGVSNVLSDFRHPAQLLRFLLLIFEARRNTALSKLHLSIGISLNGF